ncbi:hypothetical protein [Pseudoclavibacter sp. VKM Ac-2888]|uniref:hypothetical protein n=1 Tax=Pseudoclavibacter sp. VKM Ac-2888 TaxID=2783830 RepID=UPI00188DB777|nr:hypothetical protein [Pseudoclavibacter sp. VKM Ac-2888]MBF4552191.1 hypothetical protein [Pseudoclavibacter sp. VKM Ac-2888]
MSTGTTKRPKTVLLLAGVLGLEAAILAAATVFLVIETAAQEAEFLASSLALAGLSLLGAVLLALVAVSTLRLRSWVRGAAITWQIMQLAVAWVFLQGDIAVWVGWALTAVSLVGVVAAVHPATGRALHRDDDELAESR